MKIVSKLNKQSKKLIRNFIVWLALRTKALPAQTFYLNQRYHDVGDLTFCFHDGMGEVVGIGKIGKNLDGTPIWAQIRTYTAAFDTYFAILEHETSALELVCEYYFYSGFTNDVTIGEPDLLAKHMKSRIKPIEDDLIREIIFALWLEDVYGPLYNHEHKPINFKNWDKLVADYDTHIDGWINDFIDYILNGEISFQEEWFYELY